MWSGLMADFETGDALLGAVRELKGLGYGRLETYTPYPMPDVDVALGRKRPTIPWFVLAAGLTGVAVALLVMWWTNAVDYPLDVGGRPLNSFPADVPIMFETAILFASATAFALPLVLSGLPRLYHPVFEVPGFERASIDRYFLAVDRADPAFDPDVEETLASLGALRVQKVGIGE